MYGRAEHDHRVGLPVVAPVRRRGHENPAHEEDTGRHGVAPRREPLENAQKAVIHMRQQECERNQRYAEKGGENHAEVEIG